jgi:hypothetical protein
MRASPICLAISVRLLELSSRTEDSLSLVHLIQIILTPTLTPL